MEFMQVATFSECSGMVPLAVVMTIQIIDLQLCSALVRVVGFAIHQHHRRGDQVRRGIVHASLESHWCSAAGLSTDTIDYLIYPRKLHLLLEMAKAKAISFGKRNGNSIICRLPKVFYGPHALGCFTFRVIEMILLIWLETPEGMDILREFVTNSSKVYFEEDQSKQDELRAIFHERFSSIPNGNPFRTVLLDLGGGL